MIGRCLLASNISALSRSLFSWWLPSGAPDACGSDPATSSARDRLARAESRRAVRFCKGGKRAA